MKDLASLPSKSLEHEDGSDCSKAKAQVDTAVAERLAAEGVAEAAAGELKALQERLKAGEAAARRAVEDRAVAEKELKKLKRSWDVDGLIEVYI